LQPTPSVDLIKPILVPLRAAMARYSLTVRTGRALIRAGKLAATKVGREWLVRIDDVDRLLTPTIRTRPAPKRESETARAKRQLENAGIVAGSR
jgi:excisionase family DNA binding protein